jgi:hypothetical protein
VMLMHWAQLSTYSRTTILPNSNQSPRTGACRPESSIHWSATRARDAWQRAGRRGDGPLTMDNSLGIRPTYPQTSVVSSAYRAHWSTTPALAKPRDCLVVDSCPPPSAYGSFLCSARLGPLAASHRPPCLACGAQQRRETTKS